MCRQSVPHAYGTWAAASAAPRVSPSTLSPASDPCSSPQTLLARLVVKLSTPLHQDAQQRIKQRLAVLSDCDTWSTSLDSDEWRRSDCQLLAATSSSRAP
jgi:hypothetical protein